MDRALLRTLQLNTELEPKLSSAAMGLLRMQDESPRSTGALRPPETAEAVRAVLRWHGEQVCR